jgi:hypothetical protein
MPERRLAERLQRRAMRWGQGGYEGAANPAQQHDADTPCQQPKHGSPEPAMGPSIEVKSG